MTSADELFRKYTEAFEADERPSAADYLGQLEGQERFTLELMIDRYLDQAAPVRSFNQERLDTERLQAWAQKAREVMAEPSPSDLRFAREEQELGIEELAARVLEAGEVTEPTAEETRRAADYLTRLESGELTRVARQAWEAITGALGVTLSPPSGSPAYGAAYRMAPPASPGTAPEADSAAAEVFLHAYSLPSPDSWGRVDEFFLAED